MTPAIPSLPLTSFLDKEQLLLVRTSDAIRLCREGSHEELPARQSLPHLLEAGRRRPFEARVFFEKAHVSSLTLTGCDDCVLFDQLRKLVEGGALVVVRECEKGAGEETPSLLRQRKSVRALDKSKRSSLKFEGREYRLVADADLGKIPNREDYTVVSHEEAMRALDGMAKLASPAQVSLLQEARGLLTKDWRPPLSPDGLIMLKRIVVPHAIPKGEGPGGKVKSASGTQAAEPVAEEETCRPCAALRQAAQAAVLVQASQDGTPFCDECGAPSAEAA
jgi:hypothetical protein